MSDSKSDSLNFAMLARAGEGFTEWRALLLTMGSSLVCALLYWVMAYATAGLSGWMLGLVWLLFAVLIAVAGSIGYSASGVMLMDRALQRPVQSMSQAFGAGLRCMPRMLMLGAGVLVGLLVIALLASVVYLLCKIPVLGAVLGFVAQPVLLVLCGAFIIVCLWVIAPLYAPAVWTGLGWQQALGQAWTVARTRPMELVLLLVGLYVVVGAVGALLMSGFVPALALLTSVASQVLGGAAALLITLSDTMGGSSMTAFEISYSGALKGLMYGTAVLAVILFALLGQVAIMGLCLIYLQLAPDAEASQDDLHGALGSWGERARQVADKAKVKAAKTREAMEARMQTAAEEHREAQATSSRNVSDFERELNASLGLAATQQQARGLDLSDFDQAVPAQPLVDQSLDHEPRGQAASGRGLLPQEPYWEEDVVGASRTPSEPPHDRGAPSQGAEDAGFAQNAERVENAMQWAAQERNEADAGQLPAADLPAEHLDAAQLARQQADREWQAAAEQQRLQAEQERIEREQLDVQARAMALAEQEQARQEQLARLDRERKEQERIRLEQLERDKAEQLQRLEQERREQQRLRLEQLEQQRLQQEHEEQLELQRLEQEREQLEREQIERGQRAREQLEREQNEWAERADREQANAGALLPAATVACISCHQPIEADDLFCLHCGARQR